MYFYNKLKNNFAKQFDKQQHSNCFGCVMRRINKLCYFIIPIKVTCKHTIPSTTKPKFIIEKSHIWVGLLLHLIIVSPMIIQIELIKQLWSYNFSEFLLLIVDDLFILNGILQYVSYVYKLQLRVKELNGWSKLADCSISYGYRRLFSERMYKQTLYMNKIVYNSYFIIIIMNFIQRIFIENYYNNCYKLINKFALIFSTASQCILVFQFMMSYHMVHYVKQMFNKNLLKIMAKRQRNKYSVLFNNLAPIFQGYNRFFLAKSNLEIIIIHIYSVAQVIWCAVMTVNVIIVLYVLINHSDEIEASDLTTVKLRILIMWIVFLISIETTENVHSVSN